jgi:hypothetical protein
VRKSQFFAEIVSQVLIPPPSYTTIEGGPWRKSFSPPPAILRYVPWTGSTFTTCSKYAYPLTTEPHLLSVFPQSGFSCQVTSDEAALNDLSQSLEGFRQVKYSVVDLLAMTQEFKALGTDKEKRAAWMKPLEERHLVVWPHAVLWVRYEARRLREEQAAKQVLTDTRIARSVNQSYQRSPEDLPGSSTPL